jgi:hypothetical protein
MNAIQQPRPPLESKPRRQAQATPRPKRHLRQRSHQVLGLEATVKIGVNVAISVAAISALVQLLPYHWLQQERLREIRTEEMQMQERVSQLQAEFSRNFDPREAKNLMQEQSHRHDPNQRKLVLMNPSAGGPSETTSSP